MRTVINKTDQIDNTFRFFKMEVLAGEADFITQVKENNCTFTMDFSRVYWNSRLGTEHGRIVELMKKDDVILDMFAGVGPFAVAAAKNKGCMVHANDLNPHSYKYLKENAKNNRVSNKVLTYNLDGRDFLVSITKQLVDKVVSSASPTASPVSIYSHVIMNLPATAALFLDAFRGLFSGVPEAWRSYVTLPLIHCYCFAKIKIESPEPELVAEQAALQQVFTQLGVEVGQLKRDVCTVGLVRVVAPQKFMMRVSFRLPKRVAYCCDEGLICKEEPTLDEMENVKEGGAGYESETCKHNPLLSSSF